MHDTADAEFLSVDEDVVTNVATIRASAMHDIPAHSLCDAYRKADTNHDNAQNKVKLNFLNGYTQHINLGNQFKDLYNDEYTLKPLPREATNTAMYVELSYFCDNVFRGII